MDFKGLSDPVVIFNKPEKKSLFDKLRPPSTNFFKGKKYLGGALTVFLLFAVGLGVYLSQKPTQLTPQAESTLDNGLVSQWKFDETSGDVAIDSKGISNGAVTNASIVDGKANKARQIAAANSKIIVPDVAAYATNFFTVAGWIKPQSFGAGNFVSIFSRRNIANSQGLTLEYSGYDGAGNGQLQCVIFLNGETSDAIRVANTDPFKLNLNAWSHVACSYDGGAVRVYINGTLAGTAAKTGTMKNGAGMEIVMGQNPFHPANSLDGTLDEVMYWNRALIDSEIQTLAGIQPSPSPSPEPDFCSSSQDCPTGYYCPDLGAQPSGVAVDRVCTPGTAPSPSPSGSCTADAQCSPGMTCQFLNTPNSCPDNEQACQDYLNSLPKVCKAAASPIAASPTPAASTFPQGKGDGNNDGVVDLADLSILFTKWSPAVNITSHFQLDFDDNLRINSIDRAYMVELLISNGLLRR